MGIESWSPDPDQNNASPPQGAPENTTLVSDLNDIARQIMADVRVFYELQWIDLGLSLEPTGGANNIVLTGDVGQYFDANQRVQFLDGSGTKTATINEVLVFTNTTLTVDVAVTHPVSQLWVGVKPDLIPRVLQGLFVGDVVGDVTGNLNGVHQTGSIASGVTAATQSGGDDSAEVATTAFVQQELATLPKLVANEVTGSMPTAQNAQTTISHGGAGTMPAMMTVMMRCTSADAGYSVGDELSLPQKMDTSGGNFIGTTWWADATNVYIKAGNNGNYNQVVNATTGNYTDANFSNWQAVIRTVS